MDIWNFHVNTRLYFIAVICVFCSCSEDIIDKKVYNPDLSTEVKDYRITLEETEMENIERNEVLHGFYLMTFTQSDQCYIPVKFQDSICYLDPYPLVSYDRLKSIEYEESDEDYSDFTSFNVYLEFDEIGAYVWEEVTTRYVREYVAMIVDGKVISAPIIQSPIAGGKTMISTGDSPIEEVKHLVRKIKLQMK